MQRELVIRAQKGDHEAFASLVAASLNRLFAVARLILRRDDLAEDAVQEALLEAWTSLRGLRDAERFDAWIHRLLVRTCYRAAKRERGRRTVEVRELLMDPRRTPDTQRSLATRDQLERAFRRLSADQRAVLVVHYFMDLADAEAADVLDIPMGTVKSRVNRATTALRAAIEADERQALLARETIA